MKALLLKIAKRCGKISKRENRGDKNAHKTIKKQPYTNGSLYSRFVGVLAFKNTLSVRIFFRYTLSGMRYVKGGIFGIKA